MSAIVYVDPSAFGAGCLGQSQSVRDIEWLDGSEHRLDVVDLLQAE